MRHRKTYAEMSMVGKFIVDRQRAGLPLPPSMQRGTIQYVKSKAWNSLNQRCVNGAGRLETSRNAAYQRNGILLLIAKTDFDAWVDHNWTLFDALYKAGHTPSIDRIDSAKHYTIDNIQVIDLRENISKARRRPVTAVNVLTGERRSYNSATSAEVDGFDRRLISRACIRGGQHAGWYWSLSRTGAIA